MTNQEQSSEIKEQNENTEQNESNFGLYVIVFLFAAAFVSVIVNEIVTKL